jgi:hypothetical protein
VEDKKKNKKSVQKATQWGMMKGGAIQEINREKGVLVHAIPILKGQGGSPIISIVGTKLKLIGIAKGSISEKLGEESTVKNVARLMTASLLKLLEREAKKM